MTKHSEFKTCPNCKGDGYEDNPPMRRCGVCKGKGHVPEATYSDPTKGVDTGENHQQRRGQAVCDQVQGA